MSGGFFEAMFGKIFSRGTAVDLEGGLNFAAPLIATRNQDERRIDITVAVDLADPDVVSNLPYFDVRHFGPWVANSSGAALANAATLLDAILACAEAGGGTVLIPPGAYYLTSNEVATNEGTAIELGEGVDNVRICGAGRGCTRLLPVSNKVEMFIQDGATALTFEGITFDNSANGCLQDLALPSPVVPGTGTAGSGNYANTCIRQMRGDGLTLRDCEWFEFTQAVTYTGDWDDESVLVGALRLHDLYFEACAFCIIAEQPEYIIATGELRDRDTRNNHNAASDDPGHLLYVTNRPGAHPKVIALESCVSDDVHSSTVSIKKGELVVFGSMVGRNVGRGPGFVNCRQVVGGHINMKLDPGVTSPTDTARAGLLLWDCGDVQIGESVIDIRGVDGYGLRAIEDVGGEVWSNVRCTVSNMTVINDYTDGTGKSPFYLENQTDFTLLNPRFVHDGAVVASRAMVYALTCTRLRVIRPQYTAASAPSGSDRLARFEDCTNCEVEWVETDIPIAKSSNTVLDVGTTTGTRSRRLVAYENSALTIDSALAVDHHDSISDWTVAVNDLVIDNDAVVIRARATATGVDLTGIVAPAAPYPTRRFIALYNYGTIPFRLPYDSASSTSGNRIRGPGQMAYHVHAGAFAWLYYDPSALVWRIADGLSLDGSETDNAAATAVSWRLARFVKSTVDGNKAFSYTAPTVPGYFTHRLVFSGGPWAVTFPAAVKNGVALAAALTVTTATVSVVQFYFDGTNYWGEIVCTGVAA